MKDKTFIILILTFSFIAFLSSGILASGNSCVITDRASCTSSGEYAVMGLSSTTNAHGELANQSNYNYVLCCNFAGSQTCDGSNKIIGLSSVTNAHAEIPTETTYLNDVCYGNLSCVSTSYNCGSPQVTNYPLSIFSLSNYTNAHIGGISNYSINICCKSKSTVVNSNCGNGVINTGETCDGSNWGAITGCSNFDQFNGGALSCDSSCQFDTSQCTGGSGAGVCGNGVINTGETCDGSNWGAITGCSNFDQFNGGALSCDSSCHFDTSQCTGGSVQLPSVYWANSQGTLISNINVSVGNTLIELVLENSGLPNGTSVSFNILEHNLILSDDNITTVNANVDANGKAVAKWIVTQADLNKTLNDYSQFYFIADGKTSAYLAITIVTNPDCNQVVSCLDYTTQNLCGSDTCNIASSSVPENVNCNNPLVNCHCSWNVSKSICNPAFTQSNETGAGGVVKIGTCTYLSKVNDNCSNGFLTYSWIADWSGTNQTKPVGCIDGSKTLECPALIQLPFFGIYNFIIAVLLILLVYAILILRSRKGSKHKKRLRSRKSSKQKV